MSDLLGNPEALFSRVAAHLEPDSKLLKLQHIAEVNMF